jgi:ribonuclease HI
MEIYTDGSSLGNPGPGGFGVVVLDNEGNLILTHKERTENTTNNREELKAILWAMIQYGKPAAAGSQPPVVYSDSAYCVNALTCWMFSWEKKGWLKSDNKPPENLDLIQPFFNCYQLGYRINLKKVKGHAGNKWNELADKLATT